MVGAAVSSVLGAGAGSSGGGSGDGGAGATTHGNAGSESASMPPVTPCKILATSSRLPAAVAVRTRSRTELKSWSETVL